MLHTAFPCILPLSFAFSSKGGYLGGGGGRAQNYTDKKKMKRTKLKGYANKSQWSCGEMSIFFLWKS